MKDIPSNVDDCCVDQAVWEGVGWFMCYIYIHIMCYINICAIYVTCYTVYVLCVVYVMCVLYMLSALAPLVPAVVQMGFIVCLNLS